MENLILYILEAEEHTSLICDINDWHTKETFIKGIEKIK